MENIYIWITFFLIFFASLLFLFFAFKYNLFSCKYHLLYLYAWYINFPKPKYRILIESNVMLPMKDGTKLATDVYRPVSQRKFPVILIRTSYNKNVALHPFTLLAELFTSQGYVLVVQDVRGKYGSEGEFYPYAFEAIDGDTTVTWAGEAPWSNGRVAIMGNSYLGSCAWLAAKYKNPFLRTVIAMFTTQDTYSVWVDKGIPWLKGPLYWLSRYGGKTENHNLTHKNLGPILWRLPVNQLDVLTVNRRIPYYRDYLKHIQPDAFWESISVNQHASNLDIPAFIIGGWYDPFLKGTIEDYQRMMQAPPTSKNHHSRLIIGPWAHLPHRKFKNIYFGKDSNFSAMLNAILKWFEIWLKENLDHKTAIKKISYFVMGRNEWKESEVWPPSQVKYEKYFLSSLSKAVNKQRGLLAPSPSSEIHKNRYFYNPRDPVPFRGNYLLDKDGWIEPIDQQDIIAREDVLTYYSEPLTQEVTIAGPSKVILYVSSQVVDTDFCVKICDTYPNGKSYNVASGFLRMRFRDSLEHPVLMQPGEIYRIEIPVKSTAHTFLKNHRIQLQITSSDFPSHERNLNTGLNCEISNETKETEQTIYTGGPYESCLALPVLPS